MYFKETILFIAIAFSNTHCFSQQEKKGNKHTKAEKQNERKVNQQAKKAVQNDIPGVTGEITVTRGAAQSREVLLGLNGMNTITKGNDWGSFDASFYSKLNEFNLATLRYPGGTIANYWNLYPGNFIEAQNGVVKNKSNPVKLCEQIPAKFESARRTTDNTLAKFTKATDATFTKPILVLNTITSDLASQLAMLHEARMAHVQVKFVELGNEFYGEKCQEQDTYNADDASGGGGAKYAESMKLWVRSIRARFKDVEIAAVGATVDKNDTERRKKWNRQANSAFRNAGNNGSPDAIVMHHYVGTTLGGGNKSAEKCRMIDGRTDWQKFFYAPFKQNEISVNDQIRTSINSNASSSDRFKMWFTEFNMKDHLFYSHGSWGHAMFTGLEALIFLEGEDTRNIDLNNMLGNATASAIFGDSKGFSFVEEREKGNTRCSYCKGDVKTHPFTVSALGIVFREIGTAMHNSVKISKLSFSGNVPKTSGGTDGVYGFTFIDAANNEQTLIFNLSDQDQQITFGSGFSAPNKYKSWNFKDPADAGNKKDLNSFVTGEVSGGIEYFNIENSEPCRVFVKTPPSYQTVASGSVTVSRWSVTRLVKESNEVDAYALQNTICSGEPVRLVGVGNATSLANSQWYDGDDAIGSKGQSDYIYTPSKAGWHSYKLKTSCCTSPVCSVMVKANPVFEIKKAGGTVISGTAQNAQQGTPFEMYGDNTNLTYTWSPSAGLEGQGAFLNASVKANVSSETEYTLYGTDGVCTSKKSVTIK